MKTGDIIVCINTKRNPYFLIEGDLEDLTIGKFYKILGSLISNKVLISNDKGLIRHYNSGRFISLKEFRKEKILKLEKI